MKSPVRAAGHTFAVRVIIKVRRMVRTTGAAAEDANAGADRRSYAGAARQSADACSKQGASSRAADHLAIALWSRA